MAISQIWGVKTSPGETLKYIARLEKSEDGSLVFSSLCSNDPKLAALQMKAYRQRFGKDSGILLHHGFVSFKRDEVSKEKAYEFAQEFMKRHFGDYQYFGSIHVDTNHIHFNFAINAVALDGKKYHGNKDGVREMRAEVDRCCEEYNLSVVVPKGQGMSYKEWMEKQKGNDWRTIIRSDIDNAIGMADSFEDFVKILQGEGYYIKHGSNVKHIVFKKEGMKNKGWRGRNLGEAYTEEAIKERIKFKEFDFAPSSGLRKPRRKMKPIAREMMRMYYRRPSMATNFAIGIHLLKSYMSGERNKILRYSPPKKHKIQSLYNAEIQKLTRQIRFCHDNGIRSRQDLEKRIEELNQEIRDGNAGELQSKLSAYYELRESLDNIRERNIAEHLKQEAERDERVSERQER